MPCCYKKRGRQRGRDVPAVSWGRTIAQVAQHLSGVADPHARFVSLMGSLTKNSASNPFEVVQALAMRTGGEGYVLPVPFIIDNASDRAILMSQRSVANVLELVYDADLYLMISAQTLADLHATCAVADTVGTLYDRDGTFVTHPLVDRMLACDVTALRGRNVVFLGAGLKRSRRSTPSCATASRRVSSLTATQPARCMRSRRGRTVSRTIAHARA